MGDRQAVDKFTEANKQHIAHDHDGDIVYLTRLQWDIDRIERDYPDVKADRDQGNDGRVTRRFTRFSDKRDARVKPLGAHV